MAETIRIEIPIETIDNTDPALSAIISKFEKLADVTKSAQKSVKQGVQQAGNSASQAAEKVESSVKKVSESVSNIGRSTSQAKQQVSAFDKTAEKSQKSLSNWVKQKYQLIIEAKDKVSPIVSKISASVKSFAGKTWHTTLKAIDLVTSPVRKIFNLLKSPLMAAGLTLSLGAGLASSVQTFAGFEAAMSQVKAISGATGEEFTQLTNKAKQMGATTKFTATESAEAFNYMAMAGWKTQDMLDGIEGIMNLAAASGEDLGTTSDIVTDALTAFNLTAKDSGHFSDVLAQAAANANTNVGKMGQTFQYVAPVAGAMGYTIEDTALAIGLMANAGIKGEKAGTALRNIFTRLVNPPKDAAEAMEALGLSVANADGTMRPLNDVMGDLRKSFAGLTDEQKTQYASALAGQEAMSGLLAIVNASEDDYNKLAEAVNNADGASKRMSDTMLDNLSGRFTLFKSALDGVKISLGERIKPYLVEALEWATKKMPDFEDVLMRTMDRVDEFVDNTKEKISEFTGTKEWKDADLFGKIKIGWDNLIAEPFSEWWDTKGKEKIMGKAQEIGHGLGAGISTGILTLLGLDVGATINEGETIGKQFASGFVSGFDTSKVQTAIGNAFSGILKNAGKIFTGDADLTSWISAAAVAKVATPLLGLLGKGIGLGGSIIGGTQKSLKSGMLGRIIGNYSLEEDLSGAVITNASGLKGIFGKAGVLLGSGATTAKGLTLAGGGAIAGGIAGGATLISGGMDLYHGYKATDRDEKNAYTDSGIYKVGGVAAGAATGAAIGSIFGGIGAVPGALIGVGIGGIIGWFKGDKVKEDYIEAKEAADEAAYAAELMGAKSKYALEGSKFESSKLKSAMEDTTVSAERFGSMMQEAASEKIQDSFGNIKLSMKEIKEAAKQIVFGGDDTKITKFASAAAQAESSLSNLQATTSSMDKINWKTRLGMTKDEESTAEYQNGIENMITSAQQYVEDQHYQATAAIQLLIKPGSPVDFGTGLNAMYTNLQEQLNSASENLRAKLKIAVEDGVITLDEQAELNSLQKQITDITDQLVNAQAEAGMQAIKIKYSGAQLDADSFANLTSELQSQVQEAAGNYDEALEVALTNLNLELQSGAISQEQFDAQFQALTEGYQAHIRELSVNVESFQLQTIADAFDQELDGILPNLEGTVAERLGEAMHNAMSNGVDVENWDVATASKWLDLDGLSGETQAAITEMMSQVAATMSEQMVQALQGENVDMGDSVSNMLNSAIENTDLTGTSSLLMGKLNEGFMGADLSESGAGLQEGITKSLTDSLENADFTSAAESLTNSLGNSLGNVDFSESGSGLQEGLSNSLTNSLEGVDLTPVAEALNSRLGEALGNVDLSESGGGLQEGLTNSLSAGLEGMDFTPVAESINTALSAAMAGVETLDMSGITTGISSGLQSAISAIDYSPIGTSVGTGVANAITSADMGQINSAIATLKSNVGAAINSAFAGGFQTTTTVTITVNYQLANPSATISFSGGGSGTATVSGSIASNAEGSIVDGPLLSWVGEDGPEAIIPLGGKRRSRGLSLWKQAGEMLGVLHNANGSIIGRNSVPIMSEENMQYISNAASKAPATMDSEEDEATYNITPTASRNEQREPQELKIDVNISVNPKFEISGSGDEENVVRIIRAHIRELADELGDEMADKLADVFSNMPVSVQ